MDTALRRLVSLLGRFEMESILDKFADQNNWDRSEVIHRFNNSAGDPTSEQDTFVKLFVKMVEREALADAVKAPIGPFHTP